MPSGLNLGEKVVVTGGTGSEPSETAFVSEDATPPSTDVNKPVDKTVFGKRDRPNGDHRDALRGVTVKTTTGENGNWTVHAPPSAFKPGDKNSAVDGAVNKSTVTVGIDAGECATTESSTLAGKWVYDDFAPNDGGSSVEEPKLKGSYESRS